MIKYFIVAKLSLTSTNINCEKQEKNKKANNFLFYCLKKR